MLNGMYNLENHTLLKHSYTYYSTINIIEKNYSFVLKID